MTRTRSLEQRVTRSLVGLAVAVTVLCGHSFVDSLYH
jgi:hypothetical protein